MRKFPRQKGFTLIELLTAMAVAVVLLGIGVPNLFDFVARSRATTEYRTLIKSFGLARSEAITRGTAVNVSAVSGGSKWNEGYRIWIDDNGDGDYDDGEEIRVTEGFSSDATLAVTGNTDTFTFTSEGFLDAVVGSQFVFSYRTDPEYCERDRNIRLNYTGHVSVEERPCS